MPTRRAALTERQNQAYELIRSHIHDTGRPPTISEIGMKLGLRSPNSVHKRLVALEAKGYIERVRHEARGITVLDDAGPSSSTYDEGPPSAFMPRTVTSSVAERPLVRSRKQILVDPQLLQRGVDLDVCLVVVVGDDGMSSEGFRKGDLVVVEEVDWRDISKGEAVMALFDDRFVVRRFDATGGRLHFRAPDKTYRDEIFAPGDDRCYVVGLVRALMRRL